MVRREEREREEEERKDFEDGGITKKFYMSIVKFSLVDDFREVSLLLTRSHNISGRGAGSQGRVEFLPVQWHSALHGDDTGVDK